MAQRIKIKRSSSATNPANLKEGELAYIHSNATGGNLYIGRPGTGDASTGFCSSIDIVGGLIDHDKLSDIDAGAEVNPDQVTSSERTAGTETAERSFSPADVKSMVDTHALTGLSAATTTALGAIKLHDATAQSVGPETVSATANRSYSVQLDANSKASVNVPWTDTTYTLPTATSTSLGGIELFSDTAQTTAAESVTTTANRTYGIQLNSDGQAVVNVPWSNTQRAIHDSPVDGATATSISSNWAFDNVKTAVPSGALFTDTVYTASTGVTVDASTNTIAIGQAVGTTDDVTFDDLTLTGSTYLNNDEGLRFPSKGVGLGYDATNISLIPTRITHDKLPIGTMTTNERADVHRYIERVADGTENAPATKYLHLFDINGSGSITSDDEFAWDSAIVDEIGIVQAYQDYVNAKNNATGYYTDFVQDIIDGTDDSWAGGTEVLSLGTTTNPFNEIHATGNATFGDRITLDRDTGHSGSGKIIFKNTIANQNDVAITLAENGSFTVVHHEDDYDDADSGDGTTSTILGVDINNQLYGIHTVKLEAGLGSFGGKIEFKNNGVRDEDGTDIPYKDWQVFNSTDDFYIQYSDDSFDNTTTIAKFTSDGARIYGDLTADGTVNLGKAEVIGTGSAESPEFPAQHTTVKANLTVDGDLTVSGTTTTVNTEEILLADNLIELNSNVTGAASVGSSALNGGISLRRGTGTQLNGDPIYKAELKWNEVLGKWTANQASNVASPLLTTANYETEITEIDGGSFS